MTQTEKPKCAPVYLFGDPNSALAAALSAFPRSRKLPDNHADLHILVTAPTPEEIRTALDELHRAGVRPEQIVLCVEAPLPFVHDPLTGLLELLPDDSAEEIRQRLQLRLETQRHRLLPAAIEEARLLGLPSGLSADEWRLRLEAAHLSHGFACSLDLPLSLHRACLRSALAGSESAGSTWEASASLETLLPLCARLALRHAQTPTTFREEFRGLAANLPFRTRTDLRNVVERCLESLWKGLSHAA